MKHLKDIEILTVSQFATKLPTDSLLYIDIETHHYDSRKTIEIGVVSIFSPTMVNPVIVEVYKDIESILLWSILKNYHLVLQNGVYDLNVFSIIHQRHKVPFEMPRKYDDTFYMARLNHPELNTQNGFSLDNLYSKLLGFDPYKVNGINKKEYQNSVWDPSLGLSKEQYLYSALDVFYLPELFSTLIDTKAPTSIIKYQEERQPTDYIPVREHPVYLMDIELVETLTSDTKGLPLDLDKVQQYRDKINSDIDITTEKLRELGADINVNSYIQVRKVLGTVLSSSEEHLAIIAHRKTHTNPLEDVYFTVPQTNSKFPKAFIDNFNKLGVFRQEFGDYIPVESISEANQYKKSSLVYQEKDYIHTPEKAQIAELIIHKRKLLKQLNFLDRAEQAAVYDDEHNCYRVQGTFSPHAINGRIQVDNENLTQYPRTLKGIWGHSKDSSRTLIYCDFAQIELRIICALIGEETMYKTMKNKEDLHSKVGEAFGFSEAELQHLGEGVTPRFIAKQTNFLNLYGGGLTNFQRTVCKLSGVYFETEMAQKILSIWKDKIFPDIKEWHEENSKVSSQYRYGVTALGRVYKAKSLTDLNNIMVSGTGSEIFKTWLIHIYNKIILQDYDAYVVNRVHDSIIIDVPNNPEIYKEVADKVAKLATQSWYEVLKYAYDKNIVYRDVPMPSDAYVGNNWEDIEYERNLKYEVKVDE